MVINYQLQPERWQHLALVKGPDSMAVLVDNNLIESKACGQEINYVQPYIRLGRWGGGGRFWKGRMDELRIYDRALNREEIEKLSRE